MVMSQKMDLFFITDLNILKNRKRNSIHENYNNDKNENGQRQVSRGVLGNGSAKSLRTSSGRVRF